MKPMRSAVCRDREAMHWREAGIVLRLCCLKGFSKNMNWKFVANSNGFLPAIEKHAAA